MQVKPGWETTSHKPYKCVLYNLHNQYRIQENFEILKWVHKETNQEKWRGKIVDTVGKKTGRVSYKKIHQVQS